jgi:two-component system, OmpR family, phosphate regulon sensor histidine kinase PhoR
MLLHVGARVSTIYTMRPIEINSLLAHQEASMGALAVLIGAAIFAGVVLVILVLVSRSIRELRRGAERFAGGDMSTRIAVKGPLQLAALAESLNIMASQLADRLSTVIRQRNELGAVHGSMVEGVLAIDRELNILSLNRAASTMLSLDATGAIGRSVYETVRNAEFQEVIQQTLDQGSALAGEMTLGDSGNSNTDAPNERTIQLQSALLRDDDGQRIGLVLVLHDVTQLRRLESVRRDFVGNVSHEVKTPVSAIKAAVETLESLPDSGDEDGRRFLQIISRQSDRLAAIVDDLLSLARIEQTGEEGLDDIRLAPLWPIISAAIETCQAGADVKSIHLTTQCDQSLQSQISEQLLTQAVVNLIDNAVKYSDAGTSVLISCETHDGEAVVSVTDQGRGIEPKHLPRVFERFYRTDKARSRELGGTGLGLSIVKHIAEAHGGRVSVESTPGVGSTFRVHLPAC